MSYLTFPPLTDWTRSCAYRMLDEIVDYTGMHFPEVPNHTIIKIFFYVLVNQQESKLEDEFSVHNENSELNLYALKEVLLEKKRAWRERLKNIAFPLGSSVTFLMQGICITRDVYDMYRLPAVQTDRFCIGLVPGGTWGGEVWRGEIEKVGLGEGMAQEKLNRRLTAYGVPMHKVPIIVS